MMVVSLYQPPIPTSRPELTPENVLTRIKNFAVPYAEDWRWSSQHPSVKDTHYQVGDEFPVISLMGISHLLVSGSAAINLEQ